MNNKRNLNKNFQKVFILILMHLLVQNPIHAKIETHRPTNVYKKMYTLISRCALGLVHVLKSVWSFKEYTLHGMQHKRNAVLERNQQCAERISWSGFWNWLTQWRKSKTVQPLQKQPLEQKNEVEIAKVATTSVEVDSCIVPAVASELVDAVNAHEEPQHEPEKEPMVANRNLYEEIQSWLPVITQVYDVDAEITNYNRYLIIQAKSIFKGTYQEIDGDLKRLVNDIERKELDRVDQDLLQRVRGNYKIHIMPKSLRDLNYIVFELIDLFKSNLELQESMNFFKINTDVDFSLPPEQIVQRLRERSCDGITPIIALYPATGKEHAQKVLKALYRKFGTMRGLNYAPCYNEKVTSLIYIAQGNRDEKGGNFAAYFSPNKVYYGDMFGAPSHTYRIYNPRVHSLLLRYQLELLSSKKSGSLERLRKIVEKLHRRNFTDQCRDERGNTLLDYASRFSHDQAVTMLQDQTNGKMLLDNQISVSNNKSAVKNKPSVPSQRVRKKFPGLYQRIKNPNIMNEEGNTLILQLLYDAEEYFYRNQSAYKFAPIFRRALKQFLKKKPSLNVPNNQGKTVVDFLNKYRNGNCTVSKRMAPLLRALDTYREESEWVMVDVKNSNRNISKRSVSVRV